MWHQHRRDLHVLVRRLLILDLLWCGFYKHTDVEGPLLRGVRFWARRCWVVWVLQGGAGTGTRGWLGYLILILILLVRTSRPACKYLTFI